MKVSTWFNRVRFESKAARKIREEKERKEQSSRADLCQQKVEALCKEHECELLATVTVIGDRIVSAVQVRALPKTSRVTYSPGR